MNKYLITLAATVLTPAVFAQNLTLYVQQSINRNNQPNSSRNRGNITNMVTRQQANPNVRQVNISNFYMNQNESTNIQYNSTLTANDNTAPQRQVRNEQILANYKRGNDINLVGSARNLRNNVNPDRENTNRNNPVTQMDAVSNGNNRENINDVVVVFAQVDNISTPPQNVNYYGNIVPVQVMNNDNAEENTVADLEENVEQQQYREADMEINKAPLNVEQVKVQAVQLQMDTGGNTQQLTTVYAEPLSLNMPYINIAWNKPSIDFSVNKKKKNKTVYRAGNKNYRQDKPFFTKGMLKKKAKKNKRCKKGGSIVGCFEF